MKNLAAFAKRHLNWQNINIAGEHQGALANEGDRIELRDGLSRAIFSFTYSDAFHWGSDGEGFSLVPACLYGVGDPNTKEFWRASACRNGSPCEEDPSPAIPEILINEVLADSHSPRGNAVELYNPTPTGTDLSGWWLTDDGAEPQK